MKTRNILLLVSYSLLICFYILLSAFLVSYTTNIKYQCWHLVLWHLQK